MILDETDISLSEVEKEMLKSFFSTNMIWIKNSDLGDYKNIKLLGDMYELFICENNINENSNLMLLLEEIRFFESTSQTKKNDKKAIKFGNNISVRVLNDDLNLIVKSRLQKWHYECLILTPKYKAELNRGIAYRI